MSHLQRGTNHTHYIAGHKDPLGEIRYTVDKPSVIGETFQALSLAAGGGTESIVWEGLWSHCPRCHTTRVRDD